VAQPKVAQFRAATVTREKAVFCLYVTMDDALRVEVLQAFADVLRWEAANAGS
jgi:hypothetical protein